MRLNFFRKAGPDTTNRKIFRAALIVGLLGLLVKLITTLKELSIARTFGRGDEVDAFLIAFVLPAFVLNIGMAALGYSLVPVFVETRRKQGIDAAQRLLSTMMRLGVIALLVVAAVLGLAAPIYLPVLGHSFSPAKLQLTQRLLYLLLPWVVTSGIANLAASILNANEKFALPALVPMITPVITLYLVLFHSARWGIFTLVAGAVTGSLLEAIILLRLLRQQGMHLSLKWYGLDTQVRAVLAQYVPMLTGSILVGGTAVVDQSMAGMLPSGNVAALGYANKVIGGILSICALSLSTATLPYFSRMAAANDFAGCRHTLKRYSLLVVATTIPLTLVIISLSRPIVRLLFQRGAFTAADTELVSSVQICYVIQMPFYIWSMLFVRFISAIRRNEILMYASAISLGLDIALNLWLMRVWGVAGIALSTSIVSIVAFAIISTWTLRFLSRERRAALSVVPAEVGR
ncbi:MAG TPA: lipid II flippase MurJ [Candidatus Angelobacter sp.]|nr:lipid II flippase MurJ [Candidatus Angelobacter sp.]